VRRGERSLQDPDGFAFNVLEHDGCTGRRLAVTDGRFTLDGAKGKAIYYRVVFRS
jgi:hypothetical protein